MFPSGFVYQYGSSDVLCYYTGTNVECGNFDLVAGATRSFTVMFYVPTVTSCSTTSVQNKATLTANNIVSTPAQSTVWTIVNCPASSASSSSNSSANANLVLNKSGPTSITRGTTISYTLSVTNNGSATAENVSITDYPPSGIYFQSSQSTGCYQNGTAVVCGNFDLAPGVTRTYNVVFYIPTTDYCSTTSIQNTAYGASNNGIWSTNQSTVTTTLYCASSSSSSSYSSYQSSSNSSANANLVLNKSGPTSITRGTTISYTLSVTNNGSATAENVSITDYPPSGLYFQSSQSAGCYQNGSTVVCGNFDLAPGVTRTYSIVFYIPTTDPCSTISIQNTAYGASGTGIWSTNQSTVTTTLYCASNSSSSSYSSYYSSSSSSSGNISLSKSGPASITRGSYVSYALTVTNSTSSTVSNISITDMFPSSFAFQQNQSSSGCYQNGSTVVCGNFDLSAGVSRTFNVVFYVPTTEYCSTTTVQNTAYATSNNGYWSNNESVVTSTLYCQSSSSSSSSSYSSYGNANLTLYKSGPSTITRGNNITYTLTVVNNGSGTASNISITDYPPSGFSFVSSQSTGCYQSGNNIVCGSFDLAANSSKTYTVVFSIPTDSNNCSTTTVQNSASATASSGYWSTSQSNVSTTLYCSSTNNNVTIDITDSPDPVEPDEDLTYYVKVKNNSSTYQGNVSVTQNLSSDTDFISASDNVSRYGSTLNWNISLNANETRTFTVRVHTDDNLDDNDTITTTAYTGSASDTETTRVDDNGGNHDISIDITDNPDPVRAGATLTYTIALRNDSSSDRDIDVRADLDSNVEFDYASDGGRERSKDRVEWDNVYVRRNSTTFLTLKVRVDHNVNRNGSLRLEVSADSEEQTETTRVDEEYVVINDNATVYLSKQADRYEAQPGDLVTFTVTLRNTSSTEARNLVVEDIFPEDKMSISDYGNGVNSGNMIRWNIDRLSPNETRTLTYRARLASYLRHGTVVNNTVRLSGGNLASFPSASSDIHIVQYLPQTGIDAFTSPLAGTTALLQKAGVPVSESMPAIVWSSFILLCMGLGGRLSRRFLI